MILLSPHLFSHWSIPLKPREPRTKVRMFLNAENPPNYPIAYHSIFFTYFMIETLAKRPKTTILPPLPTVYDTALSDAHSTI
jgi:hypothetical protein